MKDKIVSFKVAKLAKEKGFDWKTLYRYQGNKDCIVGGSLYNHNSKEEQDLWSIILLSAPTQFLLQKWLREEKKLHISIDSLCDNDKDLSNFYWMYDIKNNSTFFLEKSGINFKTYEEALEQALEEALNLIKDKNEHRN
jgi:hypothetical protein